MNSQLSRRLGAGVIIVGIVGIVGLGLLLFATFHTVPLWQLGVFFQETNFRLAGSLLLVGLGALVLLKGLWEGRDRYPDVPSQR